MVIQETEPHPLGAALEMLGHFMDGLVYWRNGSMKWHVDHVTRYLESVPWTLGLCP